jgi:hypothetical protein
MYAYDTATHSRSSFSSPQPQQKTLTLPIFHQKQPQEFFATARRLCDETGALLIVDEVQTGVGRTGTLWGYENTGASACCIMLTCRC